MEGKLNLAHGTKQYKEQTEDELIYVKDGISWTVWTNRLVSKQFSLVTSLVVVFVVKYNNTAQNRPTMKKTTSCWGTYLDTS